MMTDIATVEHAETLPDTEPAEEYQIELNVESYILSLKQKLNEKDIHPGNGFYDNVFVYAFNTDIDWSTPAADNEPYQALLENYEKMPPAELKKELAYITYVADHQLLNTPEDRQAFDAIHKPAPEPVRRRVGM